MWEVRLSLFTLLSLVVLESECDCIVFAVRHRTQESPRDGWRLESWLLLWPAGRSADLDESRGRFGHAVQSRASTWLGTVALKVLARVQDKRTTSRCACEVTYRTITGGRKHEDMLVKTATRASGISSSTFFGCGASPFARAQRLPTPMRLCLRC